MAVSQRIMIFTEFRSGQMPAYRRWRDHVDAVERHLQPAGPVDDPGEWSDEQATGAIRASAAVRHLRRGHPLYIWRLVATLRRTLGVSVLAFPSLEAAQAHAIRTIDDAPSLTGRWSRNPDGTASWALCSRTHPVVVATRWHDRTSECGSELRDALDSLPTAGMTIFLEEHISADPISEKARRIHVPGLTLVDSR